MRLNELSDNDGAKKDRIRVARGVGSGKGKTGGRGMKGQKSRSGVSLVGKEGGQMPLYRRLPKRGFKNNFRKRLNAVNVGRLQAAIDQGALDAKNTVDAKALVEAGVIRRVHDGVRLLANGELKAKLTLEVAGASKAAVAAVEKAGGTVTVPDAQSAGDGKKAQRKAAAKARPAPGAAEDKPKGKAKAKGDDDAGKGDDGSDTTSE
jgi:large subunit ribosomal protein L15